LSQTELQIGEHSGGSPTFSGVPDHSLKAAKLILPSKNLREVTKQNTKDHNHTTFIPF